MDIQGLMDQAVADYHLLKILGKGETSTVFLGQGLNQLRVAVKVVSPSEFLPPDTHAFYKANFLRQAKRVQQLRNDHIVPLLDYGETKDALYTSMPIFSGGMLDSLLVSHKGLLTLEEISKYINQLADALDYAHGRGIIHGDIKPSNILLDLHDNVYLTDFGATRPLESVFDTFDFAPDSPAASRIADLLFRSPAFMAPEQFAGGPAGTASDIYALGVILYLLVTNTLPFEADDPIVMGMKHIDEAPTPAYLLRPGLPKAANAAILHALTKQASNRFASAGLLARAFAEGLKGQWTEELLQSSTVQLEQSKMQAKTLLESTSVNIVPVNSRMIKAQSSFSRRRFVVGLAGMVAVGIGGGALFALAHRTAKPASSTRSNARIAMLQRGTVIFTYHGHATRVGGVAWSPGGQHLASAGSDMTVQVCDGVTGITQVTYQGHIAEVYAVAWSPDGQHIASAGADKQVHVWEAHTGRHIYTYKGHSDQVNALSWSPDGKRIASASDDHTVQLWDALTGKQSRVYGGHSAGVLTVAWSPNGKQVASGSWDTTTQIWNAATGSSNITYRGHSAEVYSVSWSPDGKRIASAGGDTIVHIWNSAIGATNFTYKGHSDAVLAVAWSPDGQQIASAGYDNTVQIWRAITGDHPYIYHGHSNWVDTVAWLPNESKRIASASYDSTVQVWQA